MRIIMTCEPEEMEAVLRLIMESMPRFARHPERPGWGWHFCVPNGRTFFIRSIKGGLSASPTKDHPHV